MPDAVNGTAYARLLGIALDSQTWLFYRPDGMDVSKTTYAYSPFGLTTAGGQANNNSLQYTGRENDGTGLYYYRARYYHPTLQRFISEDPLRFGGGDANLYAYALNGPTIASDPTR